MRRVGSAPAGRGCARRCVAHPFAGRLLPAAVLALVVAGCQGGRVAPQVLEPARLTPGAALPEPVGEVVLVVAGETDAAFDLATLRRLRQLRLTVTEPFEQRERTFTVVDVADVLALARAPRGDVRMVALDDYEIVFTAEEVASGELYLAIADEDGRIPVDEGGPLRVVLVEGGAVDAAEERWIWSVSRMEVR